MNGVLKRLLVWLLRPVIEEVAWDVVNSEENEIAETELIKRELSQEEG